MAIPWTDDTNQDTEQLGIGTDELDSQSNFTHYNFVSQSRSVGELRIQFNTERQDDDSFIGTTHSSEDVGTAERKLGAEIKVKLFHMQTKAFHTCNNSMQSCCVW
ncbi:Hypothetical predicted protein [Mytilus galloprovincialis]|uniref:Uncharacterized protein n=1 Tax=Mytilus galloprovincialis TaxID=29158 RepID=A0A8B6GDK1_MYTGA